jgi:hypothetical protein
MCRLLEGSDHFFSVPNYHDSSGQERDFSIFRSEFEKSGFRALLPAISPLTPETELLENEFGPWYRRVEVNIHPAPAGVRYFPRKLKRVRELPSPSTCVPRWPFA